MKSAKHVSYHYSTFLNIIRIFSESYSYMLKMQNKCHIHYSVIYNFEYYPYIFGILFVYVEHVKQVSYSLFSYIYFWILFVYFQNLIRICWKFKTCVIFIIQYFLILLEYFLNFIRIFSKSYSCMMNMQNICDIHYSVIYIFEYYLYIFWILFIYIENTK